MEYYLNGKAISATKAWAFIDQRGQYAGHDRDELMALWNARAESEESRDSLFEISDCSLEIICD